MSKSRLIILILFVLVAINGIAQQQLNHPKKMYRAPGGKLYVQQMLPIYLRIATSPHDTAKSYLLQSEVTSKYSNPMYFDVEGYNTFRSPSQVDTVTRKPVYPRSDIIYEVYADNTPSVSSINFGESNSRKIAGKTFVKGKVAITLNASDAISGVENIYYSVDGSDYKPYSLPFTLDTEKEYLIKYYSVDNVGNVESVKSVTVVVDSSNPKTSLLIKGNYFETNLAGNASINLSATDAGSGLDQIKYTIDNGPEKRYVAPISMGYLEQGEHKLTYYAVDRVTNTETQNVYEFYVDKTPPTIIQEITGKSFIANGKEFSSGRSQLKITALDNKAGVKEIYYSINNSAYKLYEKPVTLANTSGTLRVRSYAVDNVSNISYYNEDGNNKRRNISYVDLTGPVLSYQFSGPVFYYNNQVYISNKTNILLKGTDSESGFHHIDYALDQGENVSYSMPVQVNTEGLHSVNFTGFDNIDNTNTHNFSFIVDTAGPSVSIQFSAPRVNKNDIQNAELYPRHAVVFVSATDNITGFDRMTYSLNGLPEKLFSGYISNLPVNSNNKLTIKAFDKLGNVTAKTVYFGIEANTR